MIEFTKERKDFAIWMNNALTLRCRCANDNCKYCKARETIKEVIEETFNVSYN